MRDDRDVFTVSETGRAAERPRVTLALVVFITVLVVGLAAFVGYRVAEREQTAALEERGAAELDLHAEVIRGWLNQYRALASIYARTPHLHNALRTPQDAALIAEVNVDLELWNSAVGAAETYLIDAEGTTVAASNWSEPVSFVGRNYRYRPYFSQAMDGRLGRYFALRAPTGRATRAPARRKGPVRVEYPLWVRGPAVRLGTAFGFRSAPGHRR